MNKKPLIYIILSSGFILVLVFTLEYFIFKVQKQILKNNNKEKKVGEVTTENKKDSFENLLKNKKVSELMALNLPIECDFPNLLEKTRKERKENEAPWVPTKLFIEGNFLREESTAIFTDGREKEAVIIIDIQNKGFFVSLLDGSGRMASLDYDLAGSEQLIARYDNISSQNIKCRLSKFERNIFVPRDVCYLPPSNKRPLCY